MIGTKIRTAPGVTRVKATPEENADWRVKRPGTYPPHRVQCDACGKRMWLSGIGLGSHRRACKGNLNA
jgi:hypothetical protein